MAQRLEVDKFTGKQNFSLWQRKVKALLSQYDTMDALEGIEKKPESMTEANWKRMDRKAVSSIELCLADEV
jgi:hypothetical protein